MEDALTPNQLVAYNLAKARKLRGWTQDEAAQRLEPHIGKLWSTATFSAAERSIAGERVRQFTADDLVAFSKAFDLPLVWFLMPPDDNGRESVRLRRETLTLLFGVSPELIDRAARLLARIAAAASPEVEADAALAQGLRSDAFRLVSQHIVGAAIQEELGPLAEAAEDLDVLVSKLRGVVASRKSHRGQLTDRMWDGSH